MTASPFTITPTPPTAIKLEPGQEGKLSFTVTSLAAPGQTHEVVFQALRVGEGGKDEEASWLVVGPRASLSMSGGKTETVVITVRPTADSPRGEHKIKLLIADRDRPNDVYTYSPPVACEVLAPPGGKQPGKKPLPWWLIPAIAGGLLLVGGLVWALYPSSPDQKPALGEPCDPDKGCRGGAVCVAGRCAPAEVGTECGKCGGIVKADGTCSKPTPPDLDQPCGECGGKVTCEGKCSNTTPRCPAGFTPDPDAAGQCRSPSTLVHRRVISESVPTCAFGTFERTQTINISCGANRIRESRSFKLLTPNGQCSSEWAANNPEDCSVLVRTKGKCLTVIACELTVSAVSRRPQCRP